MKTQLEFIYQGCGVIWEVFMVLRAGIDVFVVLGVAGRSGPVCHHGLSSLGHLYDKIAMDINTENWEKSVYWKTKHPVLF